MLWFIFEVTFETIPGGWLVKNWQQAGTEQCQALARLSKSYSQFFTSQPPGIVSNVTSNVNQSIQMVFTELKMEEDLIYSFETW